jgi:beta-glucosidase
MGIRLAVASLCAVAALAGLLTISRAGASAAAVRGKPTGSSPLTSGVGSIASSACPWLNQSLPVRQRVNMLLSRMSLDNKIAEMYVVASKKPIGTIGYQGIVPAQPALCIPAIREQDGSLGVYAATNATQLPSEISLSSGWDPTLAYQYGVINGKEHRAKGIAMVLGPGINIQRDPRWGRNFEMFSEDPLLTAQLGAADIEGIQSQDLLTDVKHFVTYNQETNRGTAHDDTVVDTRTLHEIYLPPFYSAVVQAHAASVMCAYPLLNGIYSCENPQLLTGLLDLRWGFPGFVRSDSAASASTVDSANAGLDQERGSFYWDNGRLAAAVADGQVRTSAIDDAVRRILTELFRYDLFNNPPTGTITTPASTPADQALGLNVAERGVVLLQNKGPVLPLKRSTTKSVAVIGSDGTSDPVTSGGGSSHVRASSVVSPLKGITALAGRRAVRSYSGTNPARAAAVAAKAQVAVVFASYWEREARDIKSISLPGRQNAMIRAVAAANHNTIVVLNTGGPVLMPWLSSVKGVIEAWYPGQDDGTAIASVLFGDTDPSGHLPETFPTSLSAIPTASPAQFPGVAGKVDYSEGLDVGYRWYDAKNVTPLFPFGYGLSYTSFGFSHLTITPGSVVNRTSGPDSPKGQDAKLAEVTAVVTNTGSAPGSDVAQLYIGDPAVAGEPPRQLEGFQRVTLQPHQSRNITFTVTGHELSYFSTAADGWTLPGGRFSVFVGDSSALSSLPLHGTLNVTKTIGERYAQLTAPPTVNAGATFTAKAQFVNHGTVPITAGTVTLTVPSGWTSVPLDAEPTISLAPGQSATRYFHVTSPESAEGGVDSLKAQLTSPGAAGSGNLSASATVSVPGPITVTARSPAVVAAGGTSSVAVSVTSHMSQAVVVNLAPSLPIGVTISPATPSVTVPANSTVELAMSVSIAAGTSPRSDRVPLGPSFAYGGVQYPMAATGLTVDVPYPTLAAAYDSTAISDDGDVGAADFDGNGDSYSEQALSAAGLSPGATVTAGATTLTWPDVPAGTPDSVEAKGQTILMPALPAATQLTFLGASSLNGEPGTLTSDYSGTGTIEYADGTTRSYQLTFDNWFTQPYTPSNTTVATAAYVNDSTSASNHGAVGRRDHEAHVFAVTIPVDPAKTVSSVTLPTVATLPGVYPMHVFALALGGGGAATGAGGAGVGSAGAGGAGG